MDGIDPRDHASLLAAMPDPLLILTPDLRIVGATDAYLAATLTERDRLVGRLLFDAFPDNPDDPAASGVANLRDSLARALRSRRPDTMAVQKYDIPRPDGTFEVRWWSPVNTPVIGEDGAVRYLLHRVVDVTGYVALGTSPDADAEARELREDLARSEAEIVLRGQQLQAANAELRAAQTELERRVDERSEALRLSEAKLRQAQRLEALGRLAGGVAHDFNNLLSVIQTFTELARDGLPTDAPERSDLDEVLLAATRGARLTGQLLAFARKEVVQPKVLEVDGVIREMEGMLRRLLGEDTHLSCRLDAGNTRVLVDVGHVEQVVLNLVINARDAVPTGGHVTVETHVLRLDTRVSPPRETSTGGEHLVLSVVDDGGGMPIEVQERVFDPFFTTKGTRGTGLGLSTVHGIAHQAGGTVWIESTVGRGTAVRVCLPVVAAEVSGAGTITPVLPRRGSETVLVVDDDDQVRAAVVGILGRAGYRVFAAANGAEALARVAQASERIHLLLTDMVMPVMGGGELADRLGRAHPGVRVLFMSGYTDDEMLRRGVAAGRFSFLQKPFTPDTVLDRVRAALDETVAATA